MRYTIQGILVATSTVASYLLGGWTVALQALIVFIVFDYIVGVVVAGYKGELNSKRGFRGIAKKVLILAVVSMAHILDGVLVGDGNLLRDAVILFYIANEVISILESIGKTGLPIPAKLKNMVAIFKDENGPEPFEMD